MPACSQALVNSSRWPPPSVSKARNLTSVFMHLCIDAIASVPFCKRTIRALYALTNSNRSAPSVDSSARKANPIPFVFSRIRNDHAERQKHGPN